MSFFSKGFADSVLQSIEFVGNIVAPISDEDDYRDAAANRNQSKQGQDNENYEENDEDVDGFSRYQLDKTAIDTSLLNDVSLAESPASSALYEVDLGSLSDELSPVEESELRSNSVKPKTSSTSPRLSSYSSSIVSDVELERKVQSTYRTSLENKLSFYEATLRTKDNELGSLRSKLATQNFADSGQHDDDISMSSLHEQIHELHEESKQDKRKIRSLEESLSNYEVKLKSLEEIKEDFEGQLLSADSSRRQQEGLIDSLQATNRRLQQEMEEYKSSLTSLSSQLGSLKELHQKLDLLDDNVDQKETVDDGDDMSHFTSHLLQELLDARASLAKAGVHCDTVIRDDTSTSSVVEAACALLRELTTKTQLPPKVADSPV